MMAEVQACSIHDYHAVRSGLIWHMPGRPWSISNLKSIAASWREMVIQAAVDLRHS